MTTENLLKLYDDFSETAFTCILYGDAGLGKTTLSCHAPQPVILNLENGLKGVPLKDLGAVATGQILDFDGAIDVMMTLAASEYQTVVIDSLTKLDEIMVRKICVEHKEETLADFGYGKGYSLYKTHLTQFLEAMDKFKQAGKNVILIAHSKVESVNDPEAGNYDRTTVAINNTGSQKILAAVDHAFYMHREKTLATAKGSMKQTAKFRNRILLQTTATGGVVAKTRGVRPAFLEVKYGDIGHNRQIWTSI